MTNVWLNGRLIPAAEAVVNVAAPALLCGMGVYDTLLLRRGTPLAFGQHLARLAQGAQRLALPAPDEPSLRAAIVALAEANRLADARVRITLGAGAEEQPLALVTLTPLAPAKSAAALTLTPFRRNEHSPLAGIKYTACAENYLAQRAAQAAGFDEALFLNTAGHLCEGAFSNVFLAAAGRVLTPRLESGCLPGITRRIVLDLCAADGLAAAETDIVPGALETADEVFLTSSLRGVQPASRVGARRLPAPGPLTEKIMARYAAWMDSAGE
jgi:branched-chain amino acid aminotransferase